MSEDSIRVFIVTYEHSCAIYDIAWRYIADAALEILACRP